MNCSLTIYSNPTAKVPERTNTILSQLSARNTLVQLLARYTDPESHNAQRYRQTVRRTDDMMMPIADHKYCVAVRSANRY